ncbi:hypothetical protein AVEN_268256-1 [Araneus ventricosus]|uniref:CCHC-type domain-containing protein n=1 Tax=Araneus ventricosus TaxID=182803 RepID=A0A4Y2C331_ARAVE|nr:hypothetical protein AVEN_268256-1 [Araneus ventricosus]
MLRNPSIIIFDIKEELTSEEFMENIKTQNDELAEDKIEVRKKFLSRNGKNWIHSLNPVSFMKKKSNVMKKKRINLNWARLSFRENLRVIQCFQCARYGHIAKNYTNSEFKDEGICLKCGEMGHKETRGDKETPNCINCFQHNSKFGTRYNFDHPASDKKCKIREKEIELQKSHSNYG